MTRVVIVATGGTGREAAAWVADAGRGDDPVGFFDEDPARYGTEVAGLPVIGGPDWLERRTGVEAVVASSRPAQRAALADRLFAAGVALTTVVHPTAKVDLVSRSAEERSCVPRSYSPAT